MLSCDYPRETTEVFARNNTTDVLTITFVVEDFYYGFPDHNNTHSIDVDINETRLIKALSFEGVDTGPRLDLSVFDSIYVSKKDVLLKVYKPDTAGKNIYNIDDWQFHAIDKHNFEYLFMINPEDLN